MALKYSCPSCGIEITTRFLKRGETAHCRNCGTDIKVPDDAIDIDGQSSIIQQVSASTYRDISIPKQKIDIISFTGALRESWQIIKDNFDVALGTLAIFITFVFANSGIQMAITHHWPQNIAVIILASVIAYPIYIFARVGILKVALGFAFNKKAKARDFLAGFNQYVKVLIAGAIYWVIIAFGLILILIPGIIWAQQYQYYELFIIKYNCGIIESFKKSARLTEGFKADLFIYNVAAFFFGMLGLLGCFIGMYVTMPITMVCWSIIFSTLIKEKDFEKEMDIKEAAPVRKSRLMTLVFRAEDDYPKIIEAVVLILIYLLIETCLYFPAGFLEDVFDFPLTDLLPVKVALDVIVMSLIVWFVVKKAKLRVKDIIPLRKFNYFILLPITIIAVGEIILGSELDNILKIFMSKPEWYKEFIEGLHSSFVGFIILTIVMAPILEEIFFRGIIVRGFAENYSNAKAIVVSALLFGLIHMNPWQAIGAFGGGLVLAWLYIETGSLIPCIYAHAFYNGFPEILLRYADINIPGFSSALPEGVYLQPWWFDSAGVGLLIAGLLTLFYIFRPRKRGHVTALIN